MVSGHEFMILPISWAVILVPPAFAMADMAAFSVSGSVMYMSYSSFGVNIFLSFLVVIYGTFLLKLK